MEQGRLYPDPRRIPGETPRPKKAGGRVNPEFIEAIRQRWQRLNLIRYRGSFPVAYRILRNQICSHKAGESL
ncbi:YlcG family protein [Raoultella ornithinolytica]|uniref:YlcG family protein n=1 Tax=Raoultella ornithinolytica TaxID=54291 RepID=UPI003A4D44D9